MYLAGFFSFACPYAVDADENDWFDKGVFMNFSVISLFLFTIKPKFDAVILLHRRHWAKHSKTLTNRSQCYSDYKSSTTLKEIEGIDPKGSFIFASMLFSGSMSDNENYWQYPWEGWSFG